MPEKFNEATWRIMPERTPYVIRHCGKCNRKMDFTCSEKFRLNGNHARLDIWLIYKCSKCDSTLKLTIKKGVKPHDLTRELFDKFTNNDAGLAWDYAFNRAFLKQNSCEVNYAGIDYHVEGFDRDDLDKPSLIHVKSPYPFELRLSVLLAKQLGISVRQLQKLVDSGRIMTNPECDIMKCRIHTDMDIRFGNLQGPYESISFISP